MSMMPPGMPPPDAMASPEAAPATAMATCPGCGLQGAVEEFMMGAPMEGEAPNTAQMAAPEGEMPPPDPDQAMAEGYAAQQPAARRGDPNKMAALLKGFGG